MRAGRDLTSDALVEWVERANASGRAAELQVRVVRRRRWARLVVQDVLWAGNLWTDVVEPVRERRFGSSRWREIQTVAEATAWMGRFLDERPDL
jgi:hypothetical protein